MTTDQYYILDETALERKTAEINAWKRNAKANGYTELAQFLNSLTDVITAMRNDTDRLNKLQAAQIVKCRDLRHFIDNKIEDLPESYAK